MKILLILIIFSALTMLISHIVKKATKNGYTRYVANNVFDTASINTMMLIIWFAYCILVP